MDDYILAFAEAKGVPLSEIATRLAIPEDKLRARMKDPAYLQTQARIARTAFAATYARVKILEETDDLISSACEIAKNGEKDCDRVAALRLLLPYIAPSETEIMQERAARAGVHVTGQLAESLGSLARTLGAQLEAVRPPGAALTSRILEGDAALPSALARERLQER